jgi:hypothetical protein
LPVTVIADRSSFAALPLFISHRFFKRAANVVEVSQLPNFCENYFLIIPFTAQASQLVLYPALLQDFCDYFF